MNFIDKFIHSSYPWLEESLRYTSQVQQSESILNTEWNHERKIELLEGIVTSYSPYQDENGAIIDRYSDKERYYSTPCYALACAVLVQNGRKDLLHSASAALTNSIHSLVSKQTPDDHPDFFPVMIMGAYRILKPLLPQEASIWHSKLSTIIPEEDYMFTMDKMKNPNRMINWNAIMISGEYVRHLEGMTTADPEWMDTYLNLYHLPRFTPLGFYQDGPLDLPNSPFSYDVATRYHLGTMSMAGYNGSCTQALHTHLAHGALSSLLTLSPLGHIPPRGRSGQHQWNEAAAAFVFTTHARTAWDLGDRVLAGAFQRAANLCFAAIDRWRTEEGNLQIVRNYYPHEERHGYEIYSNHTTYNLWTAAALAFSLLYDNDSIPELPIPAEIGSRVLESDGWFQTLISSVPGQQFIVQTALNDPYNIPGIVRVEQQGLSELIGPASSGHVNRGFTQYSEGSTSPLSYCPAWRTPDGVWHSLSEGLSTSKEFDRDRGIDPADGGGDVQLLVTSVTDDNHEFSLHWKGPFIGATDIITSYKHSPGEIIVTYTIQGEIDAIGALLPFMSYDGQVRSHIVCTNHSVRNAYRGGIVVISTHSPDAIIVMGDQDIACRNGLLKSARIESVGHEISFTINLLEEE